MVLGQLIMDDRYETSVDKDIAGVSNVGQRCHRELGETMGMSAGGLVAIEIDLSFQCLYASSQKPILQISES